MGRRGPAPVDPMVRVMRHVFVQTNGCWLWSGATSTTGYAVFNPQPGQKDYVVRWLLQRERPMGGLRLRRTCGTAGCVNPQHHEATTPQDRFWANVASAPAEHCWLWTGHLHRGYGRFHGVLAHRLAYEQLRAPIPDGLTIDHLCVTPACVNPWHMEPVPAEENSRRGNRRPPTDVATGCPGDPSNTSLTQHDAPASLADALT